MLHVQHDYFSSLANQIIVFWRCRCRCRRPCLSSLFWRIATGANSEINQSEFPATSGNLLKAREKSRLRGAIAFGFASHWLKNWREIFKPITKSSNCNRTLNISSSSLVTVIWKLLLYYDYHHHLHHFFNKYSVTSKQTCSLHDLQASLCHLQSWERPVKKNYSKTLLRTDCLDLSLQEGAEMRYSIPSKNGELERISS